MAVLPCRHSAPKLSRQSMSRLRELTGGGERGTRLAVGLAGAVVVELQVASS